MVQMCKGQLPHTSTYYKVGGQQESANSEVYLYFNHNPVTLKH